MAQPSGNLLIVDDEASVREALKRLLRKEDYVIHVASNAEDANRILNEDCIDVILCDQDMPDTTGIEFLTGAAKRYPRQRRLMISGRFQSREVASAMDTGAIHKFMMKPWDDAILTADIRASFRHLVSSYESESEVYANSTHSPLSGSATEQSRTWADYAEDEKLSRELHSAASDGSLSLAYQPQVRLHDESVCGFEALLRWKSTSGVIGPDYFIQLAERGGSISKLTHWLFGEVCHYMEKWRNDWSGACISLNVSPVDLRDDALVDYVGSMIDRYDLSSCAVQVEVTESHALQCNDSMLTRLNRLTDFGLTLAIDDFGAGATALSYLADLPFTTLKLDRCLTQKITTQKGGAIVRKILEMAQCLDMSTTIEGIETAEQAQLARLLGADKGQGYYFSKPRSTTDVQSWIDAGCTGLLP